MFFQNLMKLFKAEKKEGKQTTQPIKRNNSNKMKPTRIGELGEYKIDIQLDQLPKPCRYISDILIKNPKSNSGYSQIDHIVATPYGVFVIETKNYNGEIKGTKSDKYWSVNNNKFRLYNPLFQNYGHIKAIKDVLLNFKEIPFISIISFTMRCRFGIDPELRKISSNELVIYDVELTEYIQRKLSRLKMENPEPILNESEINTIIGLLTDANITDKAVRNEHVKKLVNKP